MLKLNKTEKYLVMLLGIAALAYVYLSFFLLPVVDNIKLCNQEIEEYNNQITQLITMNSTNEKQKEELTVLKAKYMDALTIIPSMERNPEISYNIKKIANSNSVKLDNLAFGEGIVNAINTSTTQGTAVQATSAQGMENLYTVSVNLSVSASNYTAIKRFVNKLETDKRIAKVISVDIQSFNSGTAPKTGASMIKSNIAMNYLYLTSQASQNELPSYNFNKRTYGKSDMFK